MQTLQLQQKTARLSNQQRIQKMLLWTDLQYSTFIFETGMQYLELYIPTDREGMDILSRSTIYWNWWKNHWDIRDIQFLDEAYFNDSYLSLRHLYKYRHNSEHLINSIYPNAVVLHNSYAVMIDHFNKSIV